MKLQENDRQCHRGKRRGSDFAGPYKRGGGVGGRFGFHSEYCGEPRGFRAED